MNFKVNQAVKVLAGKYAGLAGIVNKVKLDEKTEKEKYLLDINGVQDGAPVSVKYWCDEENAGVL